jgi:pimeloyl-ACP methyl ester carboxylesterase
LALPTTRAAGQISEMPLNQTLMLDAREELFRIAGPTAPLELFLRRLAPAGDSSAGVVLYVHGATFPSALSIAHRFDGISWRDALCANGFDTWGLDFYGFGASDPYPEMDEPANTHPPLGRAEDAEAQVEAAVRFILGHTGATRLSIIAHSWGGMPTCRVAAAHPSLIDRVVLFAPIARRTAPRYEPLPEQPAWRIVTVEAQWARFVEDVPPNEPPVLSRTHFDEWSKRYLATDRHAATREVPGVKVPNGPFADILRAWHGDLPYEPARVQAPVAIIRGAWDGLMTDDDAKQLFDSFTASLDRRDVKIGRGTHLMHLEVMRHALYSESIGFLMAGATSRLHHGAFAMNSEEQKPHIPGYDLGSANVAKSPITMDEWEALKKSALFAEEDVVYLRLSHDVLADHVDDLLTVWRGIIFDHPHLRAYDENPETHEVDAAYAAAVKKRFGQWVLDTASAKYDQQWLDYQYEIGLRHHRTKKNKTDGGHTLGHIRARDLIAFCAAIVVPMKPFLASKGHSAEIVNRMYDAWWKSMILQATLWVQPYVTEGDF